MAFTDEGKIRDKVVKDYALEDNATNIAKIHLIWSAWPGVAKTVGKYSKDNAVAFRKSLADKTSIPTIGTMSLIASAISDLGETGDLDQKYIDPQGFSQIQSANADATAATGGGFLDKLLSPITAVQNNFSYIKYGAIGLGVIALLWVGLPYLKAGTTGIKAISEKFKRKPNPETEEFEEEDSDGN